MPSATITPRSVDDLHQRWGEVLDGRAETILLDVREQVEFDAGHLEGSSHIALSNLAQAPALLPERRAEIWVFCRTQRRSALAVEQLKAMGYVNLSLVAADPAGGAGGVSGWTGRGYPLWTPRQGDLSRERNCRGLARQGSAPGQGCRE